MARRYGGTAARVRPGRQGRATNGGPPECRRVDSVTPGDLTTVNRLFADQSTTGQLDMRKRAAARCRELASQAPNVLVQAAYRDAAMEIDKLMPVKP